MKKNAFLYYNEQKIKLFLYFISDTITYLISIFILFIESIYNLPEVDKPIDWKLFIAVTIYMLNIHQLFAGLGIIYFKGS